MRRGIIFIIFCLLILHSFSFAQTTQNESVTISTYYPSPYGVYKNLRLYPSTEPTMGVAAGVLYYNSTENAVKVHNATGWINISVSCHLGTFTATSGTTDCPIGYYVYSGLGQTSGSMLCCPVDNP
jgi:hypothetical protein